MQVQRLIEEKLQQALNPAHLQVINESHMHSVPPNSETHFKVVVVAAAFAGKRSVARHQQVYGVLREQLDGPVHALALHTYSPDEWQGEESVPASPNCHGGGK